MAHNNGGCWLLEASLFLSELVFRQFYTRINCILIIIHLPVSLLLMSAPTNPLSLFMTFLLLLSCWFEGVVSLTLACFWDSPSLARNIYVTGVRSGGLLIGHTAKNNGCPTLRIHQKPTVQKEAGRPHKLLPISDWWVTAERPVTVLAVPSSPCLEASTFFPPSLLQCPLSLEHQGPPPVHQSQALQLAEVMICLKGGEWNSG